MPNNCLTCKKTFATRAALTRHSGTNDPQSRKPHPCTKCTKTFCSQRSLQAHLSSAAHTFNCNVCNRVFGSEHAIRQHKASASHSKMTSRGAEARGATVNASGKGGTAREGGFVEELFDEDEDESDEEYRGGLGYQEYRGGYDYQDILGGGDNYGLCDKDCGWCGHCMDYVDI